MKQSLWMVSGAAALALAAGCASTPEVREVALDRSPITSKIEPQDVRRTVEKMAESLISAPAGQNQSLQVLAEITRLRRFCCHPSLVMPGAGLAGSISQRKAAGASGQSGWLSLACRRKPASAGHSL